VKITPNVEHGVELGVEGRRLGVGHLDSLRALRRWRARARSGRLHVTVEMRWRAAGGGRRRIAVAGGDVSTFSAQRMSQASAGCSPTSCSVVPIT
jgi:hypothetical protein